MSIKPEDRTMICQMAALIATRGDCNGPACVIAGEAVDVALAIVRRVDEQPQEAQQSSGERRKK